VISYEVPLQRICLCDEFPEGLGMAPFAMHLLEKRGQLDTQDERTPATRIVELQERQHMVSRLQESTAYA